MILGGSVDELDRDTGANSTTLDDLFRRAGVRNANAPALIDPPNRESFTQGAPRLLTFAQADCAISAFAARLCRLGLRADTVVATQLPNTVEGIITLLGLLRAGMIAVPLPLLWRRRDIATALRHIGAKAIVTTSRIGAADHADIAVQVAAELFAIRFVCSFGSGLPDGVVPLDEIFAAQQMEIVPRTARSGNAAAHVAAVTFDVTAAGLVPVARSHMQLIAGGIAAFAENGVAENSNILSAIPPASFAGVALTLVPWLLGGGTLQLHHGFDPDSFAAQCQVLTGAQNGGMIVLPGPALMPLAQAGHLTGKTTAVALWRSPERLPAMPVWRGDATVMDVASFGEVGLLTSRRGPDGAPRAMPHSIVTATSCGDGAVTIAETRRSAAGTLTLRGPMVPSHAFPPGAAHGDEAQVETDEHGYVDTGYPCRLDAGTGTLTVTGPPSGMTAIGSYRFRPGEVDAEVARCDPQATIVALPDAALGERLAGSAVNRDAICAQLHDSGINPLIAGAFAPRRQANAA